MDGLRRRTLVRRGIFFTLVCGIVAALLPLTRVQPTHGAPGTLLVGDQNIETNVDSNAAGTAEAMQYTATSSGSAGTLVVYLDAGSSATSVKLGLYTDSANKPAALLTQGTVASPVAGAWNSVLVPAAAVNAGTKYWIALLGAGGVVKFRDVVTGGPASVSSSTTLSTLPSSWSSGVSYSSAPMSAYASTVDTSAPVLTNVTAGTVTDLGATVTWTTDEPATSTVQFGTSPSLGSQVANTALVLSHSLTLSGLQASTLYYARVTSADPSGNSASVDITFTTTAPGAPASTQGEWAPVMQWPFVAVHGAMLPSGPMVFWDAWEVAPLNTHVWDANVQTWSSATIASSVFCGAQLLLSDGRLMTIGGHNGGAVGIKDVELYDPATGVWSKGAFMKSQRWYPAMTMLSDGRVVAISGNTTPGNWANTPEVYNPATNTWTNIAVSTSTLHEEQYPFSFALPNGKVFVIGEMSNINGLLDVNAGTWQLGVAGANPFANGTAAMYRPGKILYTGGTDASESVSFTDAATVDMTQPSPHWTTIGSMAVPRYLHNLVDLPDGTVLAVGGSAKGGNQTTTSGSMPAEIWDPTTGAWTTMASLTDPRQYHSIAMLMPDGRVLMAGGGRWDVYPDYYTAQFYSPPYLFKGARPTISSAPAAATYGATINVTTPDAGSIASAALIKLPANTHAEDFAQTYVPLTFTAGAGSLDVQMPASGLIASPGYYMLFIVNGAGVPSVAKIIQVTSGGGPPPTATPTGTATATATSTSTPTPTATGVPGTPTATSTATSTRTATSTPTVTNTPTVTSTPTITPTPGATTTFGITTSAGANDNSDAGFINGSRFALNSAGTLSSLSAYVGSTPANAHLRLALYSNNASGNPGTLLAQSAEAVAVTGWNTLTIPGGPSLAAGTYWIAAQTDNNATVYRIATGLGATNFEGWAAQAYGAFPATTGAWTKIANTSFDMYGTVTVSSAPTSTATVTATTTRTSTATPTRTKTATATMTSAPTSTSTATATSTAAATSTSTATNSPTATATNTSVPTATDTASATATNTPPPTATDSPTMTATNTAVPTATDTPTATSTNTVVPTATSTPTPTATNTAVPTATATNTPVQTATSTPTATATNTAAPTATSTTTATATNTAVPTATSTPTATATNTAAPTATSTTTATATNTAVPTATSTPTATATNTAVPTATSSALPTATATPAPVVFGLSTSGGANDNSDYGFANGSRFALNTPGTLLSLSVYVGATPANAHIRMAIYTNNASGNPGTLLAQTGAIVAAQGWNTIAVPGNVALAAGTYWIVAQTDNTGTVYRVATGLASANYVGWGALAYGTFPTTLGGWSKTARQSFDIYGTVAP